ncbi:MAG: LysE family transporter [Pseudomonadota bacterium]|nr:LysE family transporter [Pseudomonadota bacterium]
MSALNAIYFTLAAIVLLGSPGPGIAALIAVGRSRGLWGGMRFYLGLQLGLAIAAGASGAGLASVLRAVPVVGPAMTVAATGYLIWLAYRIASAPVGFPVAEAGTGASSARGGFALGVTNPKSYIAFASLMASYPIFAFEPQADVATKWGLCVAVMVVVDLAWLAFGVLIGRAQFSPVSERRLNLAMGATILATAVLAVI